MRSGGRLPILGKLTFAFAVAILDKPGIDHIEKAEALEDHATILKKAGKTAEAKKFQERAKAARATHAHP